MLMRTVRFQDVQNVSVYQNTLRVLNLNGVCPVAYILNSDLFR